MHSLAGKRVVVVGLGTSGIAAARLATKLGARVVATDAKPESALSSEARSLASSGVVLAVGGHGSAAIASADLVVVSPGVPLFPELREAERAGVPVVGEVELAVRQLPASVPLVAVGGTNGKSTVTSLVGEILAADGRKTFTGGNLGDPLADVVSEPWQAVVLEVSSFQMERVDTFRPKVSVLLNVTPDHLDRYDGMQAYADAKGNAFRRQREGDVAVVPYGDAVCLAQARRGKGAIVTFGPGGDVDVTDDAVIDRRSGEIYERASFGLTGGHNALNVAATVAAVSAIGVPPDAIRGTLRTFRGLPHRTALVVLHDGVAWYDDSKGTNVGASVTALLGLKEAKAVLVAGGKDKGGSYEPLVQALEKKGRAAVLLGEAAPLIAEAIGDRVPFHRAESLAQAVKKCAELARPGDAVLLSPACSSFDMFKDYKERGDMFVREVHALVAASRGGRPS
ncbi:MAG: UDP-N-acetylmuramoyl-L-alanine--D-glutamate ligase [Polyangiaceae bacterium]